MIRFFSFLVFFIFSVAVCHAGSGELVGNIQIDLTTPPDDLLDYIIYYTLYIKSPIVGVVMAYNSIITLIPGAKKYIKLW